jgi:hypothetical protein
MPQQSYSYTLIDPPFGPGGTGNRYVSVSQVNDLGQVLGTVNRLGTGYRAGVTDSEPFLYANGKYTLLDVPGASSTTARLLNNAGAVIGSYQDAAGISYSFVYQDGRYQDITVPGAAFTSVLQSSSSGKLLGTYFDSSGLHPFIDDKGTDIVLSVPGATSTYVANTYGSFTSGPSINDSDQVIGTYTDSAGSHAFLYSNGNYTTLAVPGSQSTTLSEINNGGQVLGTYTDPSGTHSFVYTNGMYTETAFPGAGSTTASAINDAGQVAGSYSDAAGSHVFLDTDGTYITIDAPLSSGQPAYSYFSRLNNAGEVSGGYYGPTGSGIFLYSHGTSTDVSVPGASSTSLNGMNNVGDLIGTFYDGTQTRNFLASPVPADTMLPDWLSHPQSVLPDGAGVAMAGTVAADTSLALHLATADTGNPGSS